MILSWNIGYASLLQNWIHVSPHQKKKKKKEKEKKRKKNNCLVVLHNFFGVGVGGQIFFFSFQIKGEPAWNYSLFISQWRCK